MTLISKLALIFYWSVTFHFTIIRITESVTVYPDFQSSVGDKVYLPCNITPPSEDDAITLVLWYRSDIKISPIYTVDIRHNREKAKHLTSEVLGDRAFFNISVRPAILSIDPIQDNDGGEYRCRVDFRWGRTLSSVTNLNVIVPPKKVWITNDRDQQIAGLVGPVEEGSNVELNCFSKGGKPTPTVHWYRNNILIDSTASNSDDSVVRNELMINNIRRSDLNSIFSCQAINNNSTPPISTFVSFDIYVKPTDVKIISIRRPLSAGRKFDLICRTYGSRPPAQLTWLKDNRLLSQTRETFSEEGNVTTSVLEFIPSFTDHGSYLICRSENLRLANSSIQDEWILSIFFEPKVNLTMRTNAAKGLVAEGSQVFMECQIKANPTVVEVKWLFNGKPLNQDRERVLFIRNASLEIRSARREDQGLYQCSSSNLEGKGESNELQLDVHFSPICRTNQSNNTIGAAFGETIELQCNVEASPSTQLTFLWTFNDFPLEQNTHSNTHSNDGLTSRLPYKLNSKRDFGTVECRAHNLIGQQKNACLFNIIAAGPPEAVFDCIVRNKTFSSFMVECIAGYDGGLEQTFYLEIFDAERKRLLSKLTNRLNPAFEITGLQSGNIFHVNIYSTNAKGSSSNTSLTSNTLLQSSSTNEKEETFQLLIDFGPLFGIAIGFITAIILFTAIIILICKINRRNNSNRNEDKYSPNRNSNFRSNINNQGIKENDLSECQETKSPDIIPPSIEFTEFGHSSAIQCLNMEWGLRPNDVSVTYSNGSIPNMNYNKKHTFDSNSAHKYNDNICKTVDVISNNEHPKYTDYYYNTLPQTTCETIEPVINYSLTTNRNDTRKPTFRALSTPV